MQQGSAIGESRSATRFGTLISDTIANEILRVWDMLKALTGAPSCPSGRLGLGATAGGLAEVDHGRLS